MGDIDWQYLLFDFDGRQRWVLIECGFLAGTDGPNQYGPDPLGPIADAGEVMA